MARAAPLGYCAIVGGISMRQLFIAAAMVAILSGQALAGSPSTSQNHPSGPTTTIAINPLISVTAGGQVNADLHVGSIAFADSLTLKGTLLVGASLSVSDKGYTTP